MFRQAIKRATQRRVTTALRSKAHTGARALSATSSWLAPTVSTEQRRLTSTHVGTQHPTMGVSKSVTVEQPPFTKLMAANRGEIATRLCREGQRGISIRIGVIHVGFP